MITIDLEDIKSRSLRISAFAEGGVEVEVTDTESYHFYSPQMPRLIVDIHNHRKGFTSTILKGLVKNQLYSIEGTDPDSKLKLVNGDCPRLCEARGEGFTCCSYTIIQENINLVPTVSWETGEGKKYTLPYEPLHLFELLSEGGVITHLQYLPQMQEYPSWIIGSDNTPCELTKEPTEKEMWEIVERTLVS